MVKSDVYKKLAVVRRDTEDPGRYHYNIARIYHDPSSIDPEDKSIEPVPLKELCTTIRKRMNQYHPNRQNQRMKVKGHDTTFMSLYDLVKSRDWQIIDEGAINDGHIRIEYSIPPNTISKNDEIMYDAQKIMTPEEFERTSRGGERMKGWTRTGWNLGSKAIGGAGAAGALSAGYHAASGAYSAAQGAASSYLLPAAQTAITDPWANRVLFDTAVAGATGAPAAATWGASVMTGVGTGVATVAPIIAATAVAAAALVGAVAVYHGFAESESVKKKGESLASWAGDLSKRKLGGDEDEKYKAAKDTTIEYVNKANSVNTELSKLNISVVFPADVHPSEKRDEFVRECAGKKFFNENTDGKHPESVKEDEFRLAFHNMAYVLTIYQIVQKGDLLWSIIQSGDPCQEAENIFKQMYEITCQLVVDTKIDAPSFGHMLV